MKRVLLAVAMTLALTAAPAAAQTRVSVVIGFGAPRPFVARVYYAPAPVVLVPVHRRYFHRAPLIVVRRVYVARHRHHRHHYDYDDD